METTISKAPATLPEVCNPPVREFVNEELGHRLDVIIIDDEGWFIGRQVTAMLGYTNPTKAFIVHVDDEDKKLLDWSQVQKYQIGTFASPRGLMLINEFGFNDLIIHSRLEAARRVQRWLTHDVMPALRKTGTYSVKPTPAPINDPIARMNVLNAAVDAIGDMSTKLEAVFGAKRGIALAKALKMVEATSGVELGELKGLLPAASEEIGMLTPTQIGQRLGMTARAINNRLIELGLQERTETKEYVLTERGREYGEAFPYVSHGHSGWQIRWKPSVISILEPNDVQIDF